MHSQSAGGPGAAAAIITGVSTGSLGVHIAGAMARSGYRVLLVGHPDNRDDVAAIAGGLAGEGLCAVVATADVSDEADVDKLTELALAEFGRIDVLVNGAGTMLRKDVFATSLAEWQQVMDVNLTGTWLTNRAVGRHMCAQGAGRIINISSVYADRVGRIPESAYYSSKAGIANLTRGLAAEFGRRGVTVNCVAPGVFYPTNMTAPLSATPEIIVAMTEQTMLGRLGDPAADLHGVILFLASDAARYITGQVLFVDGGWSAW